MGILNWILYGKDKGLILDFREKAPFLNDKEYAEYYKLFEGRPVKKPTDLNNPSIGKILTSIRGKSILDVGCGRGFLVKKLGKHFPTLSVTGIDIFLINSLKKSKEPKFVEGNIEKLPFPDKSYDTVICAHVLEHVKDPQKAIAELKRVSRKRLIVIVPRQREYKYTIDLHLNFFPYSYTLQRLMGSKGAEVGVLDNDIYCIEDKKI